MMKQIKPILFVLAIMIIGLVFVACGQAPAAEESEAGYHVADLTEEAKSCVECHATETSGIVAGWDMGCEGVRC